MLEVGPQQDNVILLELRVVPETSFKGRCLVGVQREQLIENL